MENLNSHMRRLLAGSYAAALLLAAAAPVAAQEAPPQYQSSEPEEGATVHQAPEQVEVTFDQPLDDSSSLAVVDDCDNQLDDGSTVVDGNTMSIGIAETPSGDYHVEYVARGVEGLTGENEGHFLFTVHAGKPCDGDSDHHHHGGKGDKKDDKHGDHKEGGHGGMKHGSGSHDDDDHSTMDHDSDDHSAGTTHTDHNGNGTGKHDGSGAHDRHTDEHKDKGTAAPGDVPGITSSDTASDLLARADSGALIVALALCAVLGILGGVVLRSSARTTQAR